MLNWRIDKLNRPTDPRWSPKETADLCCTDIRHHNESRKAPLDHAKSSNWSDFYRPVGIQWPPYLRVHCERSRLCVLLVATYIGKLVNKSGRQQFCWKNVAACRVRIKVSLRRKSVVCRSLHRWSLSDTFFAVAFAGNCLDFWMFFFLDWNVGWWNVLMKMETWMQ